MQPEIQKATTQGIAKAAHVLKSGGLVAFATETVYGLGADATNPTAVVSIFETKGRPRFNPLIAHVPTIKAALELVELPAELHALADQFWPGPLTLVAPQKACAGICDLATAGLPTLAVRVPENPTAQALLKAVGRPVVAPSANRSGRPSPTSAQHVANDFADRNILILDDGSCRHGLESTIIGLDQKNRPTLLRPGAISTEDIENVLQQTVVPTGPLKDTAPTAPGQLASHYAPNAALRLNATKINKGEALIAFGPLPNGLQTVEANRDFAIFQLSASANLTEAAGNLFRILRQLDERELRRVAVMPIPNVGIGSAINDRLQRAAAPKPDRD